VSKLTVTQIKSAIGQNPHNRGTLRSLGLGRIGQTNELQDSDTLQGKLRKVAHLVRVDR
jgi:large subunit ribosomal protein L30